MEKEPIIIRESVSKDIPDLVRLRRTMFESMGYTDKALLEKADTAAREYFLRCIPTGEFIGWVAENSYKQVIGTGGVVIDEHPPGPNNLSGKKGYIMNLVVIQEYRRQGIADRIMRTIINWLKNQNITIANLHATEQGKHLYSKLGFKAGNELKLEIEQINGA